MNEFWVQRKLQGICPRCGRKLPEGSQFIMCDKCNDWQRNRVRERKVARKADGKCCTCGEPYFGKYKNCDSCREKERNRKNAENKKKAIERWKNIV